MTPEQIISRLRQRFAGQIVSADAAGNHPHAAVAAAAWPEVARFLRDEPELRFDYFRCLSAVDYPKEGKLVSVYDLISTAHRHAFAVKVEAQRDDPHTPSVADIWPTAEWHEREAFDLMGVVYDGHPNLTRILLPDDWQGHPLRKDYVFPKDYNGIPCSTETTPPQPGT